MGTRLVTIATFDQAAQARLAQNALQTAGIQATVSDESLVAMDWLLSNAIGGVKVQVREEDADRAVAALEREFGADGAGLGTAGAGVDADELAAEAEAAAPEEGATPSAPAAGDDEAGVEPGSAPPGSRDDYARRMVFTAVLGSLFSSFGFAYSGLGLLTVPLAFYSVYLLLNAAFGAGELSPRGRFNLSVGMLLLSPFLLILTLALLAPVLWP